MVEKLIHRGPYTFNEEDNSLSFTTVPELTWQHAYNDTTPKATTSRVEIVPAQEFVDCGIPEGEEFPEIDGVRVPRALPAKVKLGMLEYVDVTHYVTWVNEKHPGQYDIPNGEIMWTLTKQIKRVRGFGW
jgi:hypothetical protein